MCSKAVIKNKMLLNEKIEMEIYFFNEIKQTLARRLAYKWEINLTVFKVNIHSTCLNLKKKKIEK